MGGMEMVPVVGAVDKGASLVAEKLGGDKAERDIVLDIARDTPGAQIAGRARGDRMAARQIVINKLLSPLFWFAGYRRDYFDSGAFSEDMTHRMAGVPDKDIISPAPNVAAQAMEGLSYSLDEPNLREMYLNLLATASDRRHADRAHPSYAGIVRQLSATEAWHLPDCIRPGRRIVMANVKIINTSDGSFRVACRHVVNMRDADTKEPVEVPDWSIFVDNWVRLGLVDVSYISWATGDGAYDWVEKRPEFYRAQESALDGQQAGVQKGMLTPTDFGTRFGLAVRSPSDDEDDDSTTPTQPSDPPRR